MIKMVKIGFSPKEASQKLGRSSQGTIQKADKLGHPFKVRRGPKGNCAAGVCTVPKIGEVVPAVGEVLIGKPEPDYAETVRTITDQLNQIIEYADKLRQENDKLTRRLARVREAVTNEVR